MKLVTEWSYKVHIVIHAGYLPDDIIAHTDGIKHRVKTRKTGFVQKHSYDHVPSAKIVYI